MTENIAHNPLGKRDLLFRRCRENRPSVPGGKRTAGNQVPDGLR